MVFFFFQAEDGIRDLVRSRGSEMCIRDRLTASNFRGREFGHQPFAKRLDLGQVRFGLEVQELSLIHI